MIKSYEGKTGSYSSDPKFLKQVLLTCVCFSVCIVSVLLGTPQACAGEKISSSASHAVAFMAPENRWAIRLEYRRNGWQDEYNNDEDRIALGSIFDNVDLNSSLFPALALLGVEASFGSTVFNAKVSNTVKELDIGYGLTKNITLGAIIPFIKSHNSIEFSVLDGNVGFNPTFDPAQPIGPANFPFAPVGAGATQAVGTEGLQTILTDPAFGYEYEPIKSTTTRGLADPTIGALWRFYQGDKDSAIVGFGVRFGIADGDDPDNLVDVPTDDGSTDIRLRMEYYRDLGNFFDLRLYAEHKRQTADQVILRVPAPGELLATADSREKLDRDLGDIWEFDIEIGRSWGDWRTSATLHRYQKGLNQYTSSLGTDTSALEMNTEVFANQWRLTGSWSGINAWRSQKIPLPLIVSFEMQETYEARNFPDVRDYYLRATTFF